MPLQTVEPRRLYRQIADQISVMIGKGEYGPGSRLPPERDLAKQLGVSRPSVREALIALEVEGLLDVRVGSGIYVTQPGERRQRDALQGDSGPFEVIRARVLIEGECAALAAKNANPAQLRALRAAHANVIRESKRDHNPLAADRLFHMSIAEAGGNSALVLLTQTLWDQRMGPLYRSLERKLEYPKMAAETVREHAAIVSAIVRHDPRAARNAMRQHMNQTHNRYIKEWTAGK
ncbi:MAG TPA: FadR/GntR family transcriptional regulator [Burkholderiales bacterium]|nr:FadR/GntR family transcriptional regulator [Burkholderiales bacterium]